MTAGRTGHEVSLAVEAAVAAVDRAADTMRLALATLTHLWNLPTTTPKERRVMRAAGQRARRSAT